MRKILLPLLILGACLVTLTACGSENKNKVIDNPVVDTASQTVKVSAAKEFVDGKLDSFMRSVSSMVDTTWKSNVGEPLDNYKVGMATKEGALNDLQLAADMFELKAQEIEKFEIPSDIIYNESEPRNKLVIDTLKTLKVDLAKAVRSRAEVSQKYVKKIKAGTYATMTQEEMDNLLIMPNVHLQGAVLDYKTILENVE